MIRSLELNDYRGFRHYKLSSLRRINLLVGKNNSGKSSILEAVNLLVTGGDPRVLAKIARQRGEFLSKSNVLEKRRSVDTDISHFFHGHDFAPESRFILRADDHDTTLTVYVITASDLRDETVKVFFQEPDLDSNLWLGVKLNSQRTPPHKTVPAIPVSEEGEISFDQASRVTRAVKGRVDEDPVQFITPDSLKSNTLGEMWDQVLIEGKEQDIVTAMRILEPKLASIVFLTGERPTRFEAAGGIHVGLQGAKRRVPLGSYGDGMRRMLALALSLENCHNGTLLIDEIDTGLHYSIMGEMWLLVAETARRHNIQVFATTHSFDCIRGLDWLCRHHPDLGKEVSLQKIEPDLDEAVALDAEQIQIAVAQDIEVR